MVATESNAPKASYARTAAQRPPVVGKATKKKEVMNKCREAKTGTRFTFTIPSGTTVVAAKTELWNKVKEEIPNPRAKTMVRGDQLTIIPEVNIIGPRQPRIIIYDVDAELTIEDLTSGLVTQNPELGLSTDEVRSMQVKHKLGPRSGSTTHWVVEVPAKLLHKLENKSVFLGLTKCRVKLHQGVIQCFKCQGFGHTSLKCEQELSTCRHCAKQHDSRECTEKGKMICTNCKGDHKASSTTCKARGRAVQNLLRRTDFGPQC